MSTGKQTLQAVHIESPITLDGRLTEPQWTRTPTATDFRQLTPREGAPPSQRTAVQVVYREDALYVGARLYDEHPGRIQARLARLTDAFGDFAQNSFTVKLRYLFS
jgi:hypothetical protein